MPSRPLLPFPWSRAVRAGAALVALLALAPPAFAQPAVCGDASGDGLVTVSDGVQVLRAAAELSNTCTPATCDVDGNGTITVTDGVNVLRKAAELPAPDLCGGGGGDDAQVATAVEPVAPFLAFAFTALAELGAAAAESRVNPAGLVDEDDCPDGGIRRKRIVSQCITNVTFEACRYSAPGLGSFEFQNTISVSFCRAEVVIGIQVTDLDGGQTVSFDGFFSFTPSGDGFVANGGPLTFTTPQGDFELTFQELTFDGDGRPVSGAGQIADTDDNFDLQSIAFTVTGPATASLVATFDDGHQSSYALNFVSGALTPI